jgi:arylsulfatase A-like enzyme
MYRNNQPTEADRGTYCTTLFEREALRFLKEHGDRPFFLYVPFNAPHNSSSLDPKIRGTVQSPPEFEKMYPPVQNALRTETRDGREARVPTAEKRTRDYRAAVTCMDASIGKLLDVLDERGLAETTLVMFLSDNGGSGGADNTPLRGGKGQTWEGGIRVLSLIRWPAQLPAGVVNDEFLTTMDVLPTLIKAAGAAAPQGVVLDGFDMLPALKGEQKSPRQEMFWKRRDLLGARVENWKWVDLGGIAGGLFDLENDPGERHDLSQERPDVLRRVKGRYQAWLQAMEAAEPRGPFRDY